MARTKKKDPRVPEVGQVWSSPCTFTLREDGISLKPGGVRNADGNYIPGPITGAEERVIVAVIEIPGYQRRVIYTRRFRPIGYDAFGRTELKMIALSAFNQWRNGTRHGTPAQLITKSHIETALEAIRERVAA